MSLNCTAPHYSVTELYSTSLQFGSLNCTATHYSVNELYSTSLKFAGFIGQWHLTWYLTDYPWALCIFLWCALHCCSLQCTALLFLSVQCCAVMYSIFVVLRQSLIIDEIGKAIWHNMFCKYLKGGGTPYYVRLLNLSSNAYNSTKTNTQKEKKTKTKR